MNQNFGNLWSDIATDDVTGAIMSNAQPLLALHCSGADGRQ